MTKAIPSRQDSVAGVSRELWSFGFDAVAIVGSSLEKVALNPIAEKLVQSLTPQTLGPERKFLSFLRKRGIFTHVPSFDNEIQYEDRWLLINIIQTEEGSFAVVIKDISETKALETQLVALKAANNELNEIIELSADGLVSLDHTGMILRMNKAYEKDLGIKAEEYLGKPAKLIQERGHLPDLVSKYVLKDLKPKNIFVKLKDKEVLLTGRPVFNEDGALIRVVANIRDLTELNHLKNTLKDYHELTHRYETEIQRLRAREFETEIVGHSIETQRSLELAIQASMVDSTALICGETGTGKELFAKTIHKLSKRANGPFIAINCSALPKPFLNPRSSAMSTEPLRAPTRRGKSVSSRRHRAEHCSWTKFPKFRPGTVFGLCTSKRPDFPLLVGARKSTVLIAENLGFKKGFRQRRAADRDEGFRRPLLACELF